MGMRHLPTIVARLIREGVASRAAVTCIANASLPAQEVVRARLKDLPAEVAAAGLSSRPSLSRLRRDSHDSGDCS